MFCVTFADDLKLLVSRADKAYAQADLEYLNWWQNTWLLRFNTVDNKCKVLHAGPSNNGHQYMLNNETLPVTLEEKDLGVTVTKDLNWSIHIKKCIGKANQMVGWTTRNIIRKDLKTMMVIYKSLIRPHLEYCVQLWNPEAIHGSWGIILDIEKVQRDMTRRIDGIGLMSYRKRLQECGITTLIERRARGDLIECFKIWKGLVDYGSSMLNVSRSGYNLVLRVKKGSNLHSMFPNRIISYWNNIPDSVKDASSVDSFKARLGQFKNEKLGESNKGHYWDLSEEILAKIESRQSSRQDYETFMINNPNVAKRKFITDSTSSLCDNIVD